LSEVRLWIVGLGTVGRWLLHALDTHAATLSSRYGFTPTVVGVANARDGFIYDSRGVDLPTVLRLSSHGQPLTEHPGVRHWPSSIEGLQATDADVLVEVTASPREGGEPGVTHMRAALGRQISVVTSNKWPVALHGVALTELARAAGVAFRAESTVMSGTPVLSTLQDGLAGTTPNRVRGVLNATANVVLTTMAAGKSYDEALAGAQEAGLAERDPSADVDGYDSVAKAMILAGLVFGTQVRPEDVSRRGITEIGAKEVMDAVTASMRIRLVSSVEPSEGRLTARVEPVRLPIDDPLARIDGALNAIVCDAEPVGEVTIVGPGAGPQLAGQGVLSDLIAVVRRHANP
jgi:homoserine dehydrogenase